MSKDQTEQSEEDTPEQSELSDLLQSDTSDDSETDQKQTKSQTKDNAASGVDAPNLDGASLEDTLTEAESVDTGPEEDTYSELSPNDMGETTASEYPQTDPDFEDNPAEMAQKTQQRTQTSQPPGKTDTGNTQPSQRNSNDDRIPGEVDWGPEIKRQYEAPDSTLKLLQYVDEFLDEIDEDLPTARERLLASDHYQTTDWAGSENSTTEQLNFNFVTNDGIIVNRNDGKYGGRTFYFGIQKIDPTRWKSRDKKGRKKIMSAYTAFLMSLQWGIAIPCYPKAFNFEQYLENIYEAGVQAVAEGEHPLIDYGRRYHIQWADQTIDPSRVKRKEFYLITKISEQRMKQIDQYSGDSVIGKLLTRLSWRSNDYERGELEELCIEEIRSRQRTMRSELNRTSGLGVKKIDDREEALELLYYYWNHVEPVFDSVDHSTFTEADFSKL